MNFLPGKPIKKEVYNQIKQRQKAFKSLDGFDREAYTSLQQAIPWVRLSSAVKIAPNTDLAASYGDEFTLAKSNILFNFLNQGENELPGYEYSQEGLGYRPKPGITGIEIHSHNRFGSLRTAVVRFQCWTKEQIDRLELLYMRPGYTLLLEWGWSGYIDTETGEFVNNIQPVDLYSYSSGEKLRTALEDKIAKTDYNYDAIFGLIKNFSWTARPDGGYDCTTSIVTTGELIESYKANFYLSAVKVTEKVQSGVDRYNETREEKRNKYTDQLPPEFKGLELRFYSADNDDIFANNSELIDFKNQASAQATQIQTHISDLILAAGDSKIVAEDYEVVSEKTTVVSYTDLTRPENNQRVEVKPQVALVKVRTTPVQFALKINASNISEASGKLQKLINISNSTLKVEETFSPGSVIYSEWKDIPKGAWTPKFGETKGTTDLKFFRFFVLTYTPEVPTENPEQVAQETAAVSAKAPELDTSYASLLHDLLINDINRRISKEYEQEFKSPPAQATFKEVFKHRKNVLLPGTLLQKIAASNTLYQTILSGAVKNSGATGDQTTESTVRTYIKLGLLLEALNYGLLQTTKGEKLFKIQTKPVEDNRSPEYFLHEDQFSINPEICILPSTLSALGVEIPTVVPPVNTGGVACAILDIELGTSYLVNLLDGFIIDNGRIAIYDMLQQIFDDIKKATGGVIELDLQYSEVSSTYAVVDRRKIARPDREFPVISLLGRDSTITDLNLVSKLTPRISSMVAISAQESPFTSTEEAAGFEALNKGLVDGIYPEKKDALTTELDNQATFNDFLKTFREEATTVKLYLDAFYVNRIILEGADIATGNYENYCKTILGKKFKEQGAAYSFIIPFELTIGMRGIGGLHVMESFKIDKAILPTTYGGRVDANSKKAVTDVAFMITGLEHQVSRQGWTTNVKTQIYNVDKDLAAKPAILNQTLLGDTIKKSKGVTPSNTPWSAAFISYVHQRAGYTNATFPFAQSHTTYAQQIRTSYLSNFEVLDPATNAPQPGDIIVANRQSNKMRFSNKTWSGYSHGDIVVDVQYPATTALTAKADVTVIGGNIGQTVSQSVKKISQARITQGTQFVFQWVLSATGGSNGDGDFFAILRPKSANLKKAVIDKAKEEYNYWKTNKFIETSPGAFDRLAMYWKTVGVQLKSE